MASIDLPAERSAVGRARRFARDTCSRWGLRGAEIDDVELLVSELVTNAVLHARSPSRVTIEHLSDRVRVDVSDESAALPRLREYGPEAATGRGVYLVDRISSGWGVDSIGLHGKRVWFELLVGATESTRT